MADDDLNEGMSEEDNEYQRIKERQKRILYEARLRQKARKELEEEEEKEKRMEAQSAAENSEQGSENGEDSKQQKMWRVAKNVAGGAKKFGAAGLAVGAGAWAASKATGRGVKHVARKTKDFSDKAEAKFGNAYKAFFWITLIWHIIDAWTFWVSEKSGWIPIINKTSFGVYLVIAVLAWILFFRFESDGSIHTLLKYFGISAVAVVFPALTAFFPDSGQFFIGMSLPELLRAVLLFIPIWPLYIANHFEYKTGRTLLNFIWAAIIIAIIFTVVLDSEFLSDSVTGAGGVRAPAGKVWDVVKEGWTNLWKTIVGIPGNVTREIRRATDPNYESEVEKNKYGELGVKIDSLQTTSKEYTFGDSVDAFATIKGQTFVGVVKVENSCYLDNVYMQGKIAEGYEQFTVTNYDERYVPCSFNAQDYSSLNISKKKNYNVYFQSDFNFETWGYITYSFIDRNIRNGFFNRNEDINQFYNLEQHPKAVYTAGPVELGLVDKSKTWNLPYSVDSENPIIAIPFGITIKNEDPYGKVVSINELEFKVPAPLKIKENSCVPSDKVSFNYPDTADDGYYVYDLQNIPLEFSRDQDYITIQCLLEIKDNDVDSLLGTGGVSINTFTAKAKYTYQIIRSTPITFQEAIS